MILKDSYITQLDKNHTNVVFDFEDNHQVILSYFHNENMCKLNGIFIDGDVNLPGEVDINFKEKEEKNDLED